MNEERAPVAAKGLVTAYPTEAEDAPDFLDALAARRADGRPLLGLHSGFPQLNEVLNGLTPGVFILAGAPSTGKTTLAKQIADSVAEIEQVPVMFWSFEQSKEELRIKSLARIASVDSWAIWKGRTDDSTWERVKKADEYYRRESGRWLTVIEAGRTDTIEAIRSAALMTKRKAGGDKPILLVLDYLQILPSSEGECLDGTKDKVDRDMSELRRLSRDLKSPILVISSEGRDAYKPAREKYEARKPTLTALEGSGGIEYSADAVLCLWRDNLESERLTKVNHRKTVRIEVYILKNRNGDLGKIKLDFTPAWATFGNEKKAEDLAWFDTMGEGE
jgi:replicative DNA helicase